MQLYTLNLHIVGQENVSVHNVGQNFHFLYGLLETLTFTLPTEV